MQSTKDSEAEELLWVSSRLATETSTNQIRLPTVPQFDVLLSHRGPDVKRNFCAFLREALERAGIKAFVDDLDLQPGNHAWGVMETVLRNARIVIPVLSEGYAQSKYCLDELVIMMDQPDNVIPVFFGVEPDLQAFIDSLPRWEPYALCPVVCTV